MSVTIQHIYVSVTHSPVCKEAHIEAQRIYGHRDAVLTQRRTREVLLGFSRLRPCTSPAGAELGLD